jgi:hypothetical protein
MRRFKLLVGGVALPLLVVCLALSGCKKASDEEGGEEGGGGGGGGNRPKPAVTMTGIKKGDGVIKGKVVLKGSKPNLNTLTEELQKRIRDKDDKDYCLAGSEMEKSQQHYRLGTNGNVGNVFVWVMPPDRNSFFEFSNTDIDELKVRKRVDIGQPHCAFVPHCELAFTAYATKDPKKMVPTGQEVWVVNNARKSHNTKWPDTGKIPGKNELLPAMEGDQIVGKVKMDLVPESSPVQFECSIHPWMNGYIWSLNHPYAAITKSDTNPKETAVEPDKPAFGTYEIRNVPTGQKLKIVAWHEEARYLTPDKNGVDIEVPAGGTVEKDFELEAK